LKRFGLVEGFSFILSKHDHVLCLITTAELNCCGLKQLLSDLLVFRWTQATTVDKTCKGGVFVGIDQS
jgi:hypothetical protein